MSLHIFRLFITINSNFDVSNIVNDIFQTFRKEELYELIVDKCVGPFVNQKELEFNYNIFVMSTSLSCFTLILLISHKLIQEAISLQRQKLISHMLCLDLPIKEQLGTPLSSHMI
jgi:hypothetical protein